MTDGIYTLANDRVFDQLVALLNSIEQNSPGYPVCVIAYDGNIERVQSEIDRHPTVTLMNDAAMFSRWEDFSLAVWKTHPTALKDWQAAGVSTAFYRVGENHRYAGFDAAAPFERFIYLDADTLVMRPLDFMFERLDQADTVVYDFQFKDLSHIFNVNSTKPQALFGQERLETEIFCSGCYASHRGLFPQDRLDELVEHLAAGDSDALYMGAPNQSLLNYMMMKSGYKIHNVALEWRPQGLATGNAVTSKHFEAKDHVLYDKGNRLAYLHFIGMSSKFFRRLCSGENIDFPYRDIFLHYRYLKDPQERPELHGEPVPHKAPPLTFSQKVLNKLGLSKPPVKL